jgi:hypothetical protein
MRATSEPEEGSLYSQEAFDIASKRLKECLTQLGTTILQWAERHCGDEHAGPGLALSKMNVGMAWKCGTEREPRPLQRPGRVRKRRGTSHLFTLSPVIAAIHFAIFLFHEQPVQTYKLYNHEAKCCIFQISAPTRPMNQHFHPSHPRDIPNAGTSHATD